MELQVPEELVVRAQKEALEEYKKKYKQTLAASLRKAVIDILVADLVKDAKKELGKLNIMDDVVKGIQAKVAQHIANLVADKLRHDDW